MCHLFLLALLILCFAACVPATVPPQLAHTPGPTVRLNDHEYDSGVFRVRYPAGWRVITSAASNETAVIFASVEGDALMMVGAGLVDAPPPAGFEGDLRSERREITLDNGLTIVAILNTPPEKWTNYAPLWRDVAASITASQSKTGS